MCIDGVNVVYFFRSNMFHFFVPVLIVCFLMLTACGSEDISDDVVISTITEPVASSSSNSTAAQTPATKPPASDTGSTDSASKEDAVETKDETPSPQAAQDPEDKEDKEDKEDIVHSIVDLHKRFGEPPAANYGRLSIPALDIDAPVGKSIITDGIMTNPIGPSDVVYYDFQDNWVNFGGDVGTRTNAIFSGHVDYVADLAWIEDVRYEGVGVFFNISLLSPGDVINIRVGERTYVYGVVWRRMIPAESDEWESILRKETGLDMITLITCTGEFDPKTLEYAERTVVRAHRM